MSVAESGLGSGGWLPLYAAVILGTIGAAAIVAFAFGRPGSAIRRLGLVVLALAVWILAPVLGVLLILVTHPMV